jgi:lipid-binding SYLF domain-containing protein
MYHLQRLVLVTLTVLLTQCTTVGENNLSSDAVERREAILTMRQDVLEQLYEVKPDVKAQIENATGHAVFSNANLNLLFASFGGGTGVVQDRKSGKNTYMNMGEIGFGLGAGIKDFRAVFVFHNKAALRRFVDRGWTFGGQAGAAAIADDMGAAVGGETAGSNVTVYQITKSGLVLQAMVKGTRYWKNADLN